MKIAIVIVVATVAFVAAQAAAAEGVWVNGTVHGLVTAPPTGSTQSPVPLYVIAPVSARHPLHPLADARTRGFGAHDHVAAKVFTGPCDLTLLVPGPRGKGAVATRSTMTPSGAHPLVYAARIGGEMVPLTSVARIERAVSGGLVAAINTHVVISCAVSAA
jgi:hypothetical protein